ncbi:sigma-54-dependent transcriptional regulator [Geobacter argillaceus]|uniref:Two-component system NtrC family response regulator/two-component system response regulator HydG n=1 Tax=Geobacter argillaceus TaxID=345631 RepID=A0A562V695_9BACT|nr:sigma-54 dependent transcriptional regulator [Geobacter argillaceus]TWJ13420.1 two-component system NtrC family response regulator/two-component system response regulator HydG [Geobacter argillaceus]
MAGKRVLVVDDSAGSLRALRQVLGAEGYEVVTASLAQEAIRLFEAGPAFDAVLADLKMPGMDGLQLYRHLVSVDPMVQFIIMTAHGTIESSVEAMKEGVYDYLVKPLNTDELLLILGKAIRERQQRAELTALRAEVAGRYGFHNIVGQSLALRKVFDMVKAVAPTDATVLITGETGTGKELFAKAIHFNSPRGQAALVSINCAALSESLLEAELFGHVKGAFTGATTSRIGRLEAADQGTLFLDEIGHMSLALQAKLLRFLQERTFEPVGSSTTRTVNTRIIAATNREMEGEVRSQRFLPDLYYRLQVIQLTIPPLRERKEDIPLLAAHFIEAAAAEHGRPVREMSNEVIEALKAYSWPGNVRELKNMIDRLTILGQGQKITVHELPPHMIEQLSPDQEPSGEFLKELPPGGVTLQEVQRELLAKTLQLYDGNRTFAAKALGISRKSLWERIERFGLS